MTLYKHNTGDCKCDLCNVEDDDIDHKSESIILVIILKRLKYFDVHLLLSDMHLSEQFGSTHKNYNNLKTKIYKTKTIKKNYKASKIERAYSLKCGSWVS